MKNTFLKITVCAAAVVIGTSAFAGDHCNSGVRLAADIVDLVGCSLNILRGPTVVYTEPVVYAEPAPVVYTAPAPVVYTAPVYCPPPRPCYRPLPPPPPPRHYWYGPRRGPGPCGPRPGPCGPRPGPCGPRPRR